MTKKQTDLEMHMERLASGREAPSQLQLDPATGELVLVPRSPAPITAQPDGVVIDQIAEDGFFAPPRVVIHDGVLDAVESGGAAGCIAVARDELAVLHVFADDSSAVSRGTRVPCVVVSVAEPELAGVGSLLEAKAVEHAPAGHLALAIAVCTDAKAAAAALVRDGRAFRCDAQIVPGRDELCSRSRGLLETDALAERRVGVVGVGSGGSAVAVELAKAGVGGFVLIDPDVLEPANVARHVCGIRDLGREKVHAVRDALLDRNPYASIEAHALDVNADLSRSRELLEGCDLVIGATDGNRSRANINAIALELGVPALFGRALTRAAGGDVLRVRPHVGPCLACVFALGAFRGLDEEVSTVRQVDRDAPAYVSPEERDAMVQPGLATDIAPIANMMSRLALLELSRGTSVAVAALEEDLAADLYIWANRRERTYAGWRPMAYGSTELSILRWYGVRAARNDACTVCTAHVEVVAPTVHRAPPPSWS